MGSNTLSSSASLIKALELDDQHAEARLFRGGGYDQMSTNGQKRIVIHREISLFNKFRERSQWFLPRCVRVDGRSRGASRRGDRTEVLPPPF